MKTLFQLKCNTLKLSMRVFIILFISFPLSINFYNSQSIQFGNSAWAAGDVENNESMFSLDNILKDIKKQYKINEKRVRDKYEETEAIVIDAGYKVYDYARGTSAWKFTKNLFQSEEVEEFELVDNLEESIAEEIEKDENVLGYEELLKTQAEIDQKRQIALKRLFEKIDSDIEENLAQPNSKKLPVSSPPVINKPELNSSLEAAIKLKNKGSIGKAIISPVKLKKKKNIGSHSINPKKLITQPKTVVTQLKKAKKDAAQRKKIKNIKGEPKTVVAQLKKAKKDAAQRKKIKNIEGEPKTVVIQ